MSTCNDSRPVTGIVFGYSLLGFRPIVRVGEEGLVVGKRQYRWDELKEFIFFYGIIGPPIGIPHAVLTFSDRRKLKIDVSRFKKHGESRRPGFISGVTPAFSEFAHIVKRKAGVGDPLQWGV